MTFFALWPCARALGAMFEAGRFSSGFIHLGPLTSTGGKAEDARMKRIVVAVAITGSVPRKKDNPALPVTPAEQVESTHEAYEAGATLVHIQVRNPDESSSSRLADADATPPPAAR